MQIPTFLGCNPGAHSRGQSPPGRAAALHLAWIIKSGGPEYPFLTQNEFLCREAARCAGIPVPDCFLSDDNGLLVWRRFGLVAGQRLGFEDFAVLLARPADPQSHYQYRGSYETVAKMVGTLVSDQRMTSRRPFFECLVLSVIVRNGDAHLKNFGLFYSHPGDRASVCLAPSIDVVTTPVYPGVHPCAGASLVDRTMALKRNGVKNYATGAGLVRFGGKFAAFTTLWM